MGVTYASVDDLEDELDGTSSPAHPDRLLIHASTAVDLMLRGAMYDVSPTGAPTDPDDIELLRTLTVLQAVWMAEDPEGRKAGYSEIRTSTVTVKMAGGRPVPRYAPRAVEHLLAHGMPGRGLSVLR